MKSHLSDNNRLHILCRAVNMPEPDRVHHKGGHNMCVGRIVIQSAGDVLRWLELPVPAEFNLEGFPNPSQMAPAFVRINPALTIEAAKLGLEGVVKLNDNGRFKESWQAVAQLLGYNITRAELRRIGRRMELEMKAPLVFPNALPAAKKPRQNVGCDADAFKVVKQACELATV
jgi:hypothetical protein